MSAQPALSIEFFPPKTDEGVGKLRTVRQALYALQLGFRKAPGLVADGRDTVGEAIVEMAEGFTGLVVTTGGTGFGPRDPRADLPDGPAAPLLCATWSSTRRTGRISIPGRCSSGPRTPPCTAPDG